MKSPILSKNTKHYSLSPTQNTSNHAGILIFEKNVIRRIKNIKFLDTTAQNIEQTLREFGKRSAGKSA